MKHRDILLIKVRAQIRALKVIRRFKNELKKEMEKNVNTTRSQRPSQTNVSSGDVPQYGG